MNAADKNSKEKGGKKDSKIKIDSTDSSVAQLSLKDILLAQCGAGGNKHAVEQYTMQKEEKSDTAQSTSLIVKRMPLLFND